MAERIEFAEKVAPTRPHPHAGASAAANLLVGPPPAIFDRERDTLRKQLSIGDGTARTSAAAGAGAGLVSVAVDQETIIQITTTAHNYEDEHHDRPAHGRSGARAAGQGIWQEKSV
ncbi:hypothetical protein [Nocardia sp. BMG111209]|uniref:hypothetical protein n=1 Tax=Nocardia sp. BMG111209 TaxID=1160137 RepID=UPI00037B5EED|nr:hypothetical protein [Nocardia sp. BMG111209]